jgi:hypothetical protein
MYERLVSSGPSMKAATGPPTPKHEPPWMSDTEIGDVEVVSEDRRYPIEQLLNDGSTDGWRAAHPGRQVVRVRSSRPRRLRRVVLESRTSDDERAQDYLPRCSSDGGTSVREFVRQRWNLSRKSPCETEDHRVDPDGITMVEIDITPDVGDDHAHTSLARLVRQ